MMDRHHLQNPSRSENRISASLLYAEGHNGVDDIVIVLPQGLDGLLAGNVGLGNDQVNVLGLEAALVNLLTIVLLLVLLGLDSLAEVRVIVTGVVVASVVTGSLSGSELLGGGSLGLGVQILNLGLTEDAKRDSQ